MRVTLESRMKTTYGADNLIRYDASVVRELKIPQEAKDFLISVGMPRWSGRDIIYGFPFNNLPTLKSISEDALLPEQPSGFNFLDDFRHFRVIGLEALKVYQTQGQTFGALFSFVCLDEKQHGRVVMVATNPVRWYIRFFNSSVLHLAQFMVLFAQVGQRIEGELARKAGVELTDTQKNALYRRVSRQIIRELKAIDPPACEIGTAWGGVISDYWLNAD